jgi:DNA-binding FadR family transcriptional regulator
VQEGKFDFPRSEHLARVFERSDMIAVERGEAVKTTRLRDAVVERLAKKIVEGTYALGAALPNEDELCNQLAVSRSSIREAVRGLAAKGMVESRTRVGTLVLAKDRWSRLDPDVLRWTYEYATDGVFDRSLIEARRIIEPAAAEIAAERATSEDLHRLEEALNIMTENFDIDLERCSFADLQFHRAILIASHNDVLIGLGSAMSAALLASFRRITSLAESHKAAEDAHRAVFEAIRARDPNLARVSRLSLLEIAHSRFGPESAARTSA